MILPLLQRSNIIDPEKFPSRGFLTSTMDVKKLYFELIYIVNCRFRAPHKKFETSMKDNFKKNLLQNMKATNLYSQMKSHGGICSDKDALENNIQISCHRFWNLHDHAFQDQSSVMKETQVVISSSRDKCKNDIKWFYSEDKYTHKFFLARIYIYGLGNFLDNVYEIIN